MIKSINKKFEENVYIIVYIFTINLIVGQFISKIILGIVIFFLLSTLKFSLNNYFINLVIYIHLTKH